VFCREYKLSSSTRLILWRFIPSFLVSFIPQETLECMCVCFQARSLSLSLSLSLCEFFLGLFVLLLLKVLYQSFLKDSFFFHIQKNPTTKEIVIFLCSFASVWMESLLKVLRLPELLWFLSQSLKENNKEKNLFRFDFRKES